MPKSESSDDLEQDDSLLMPINEPFRAWMERAHWAMLDFEEGLAPDLEDAVARKTGPVHPLDDAGALWEVMCFPRKRKPEFWDLELTRQEIADIAEERRRYLRLRPCRHPECQTLVRRRSGYCFYHESDC